MVVASEILVIRVVRVVGGRVGLLLLLLLLRNSGRSGSRRAHGRRTLGRLVAARGQLLRWRGRLVELLLVGGGGGRDLQGGARVHRRRLLLLAVWRHRVVMLLLLEGGRLLLTWRQVMRGAAHVDERCSCCGSRT